ncbi:hypothetical protein [Williamsia muralis]|uniref:Transcriptional regulator n=1 Tax=Williamsia marianensis TaxID=85044 RepID=A0ABU4EZM8_WILMA|nr:hypothetical protein [Williamsia muralis]MDV7136705.1 hypothetical protein [Williamsia muralis]
MAPTTYAQRAVYFRRAAEIARDDGDLSRAMDLEEFAGRCDSRDQVQTTGVCGRC